MVTDQVIDSLQKLNIETLLGLKDVLTLIDQRLYTHVNTKGRASVGQHVRHTIEFYQCLFCAESVVNYDTRKRDILLESSPNHSALAIDELIEHLGTVSSDRSLSLAAELPVDESLTLEVQSSLSRELLYVLEHAIHHMALIRVLIKDEDNSFELPDSFGVAYSTLAHRSQQA